MPCSSSFPPTCHIVSQPSDRIEIWLESSGKIQINMIFPVIIDRIIVLSFSSFPRETKFWKNNKERWIYRYKRHIFMDNFHFQTISIPSALAEFLDRFKKKKQKNLINFREKKKRRKKVNPSNSFHSNFHNSTSRGKATTHPLH